VTWISDSERTVDLHPGWRTMEDLPDHLRSAQRIGRSDLLAVAAECRGTAVWTPLLTVVNAWCYGRSGYGAWRTRRILDLVDVGRRLTAAVATLDADGPLEAYYQLNNDGHLHGWGPTMFTRFLDVADQRGSDRALGLDAALARAVNELVPGCGLGAADWGTAEYAFYLGLMHRIAAEAGVAPPMVEAALAAKFAD
jgi:hypothetical protein